MVDRDGDTDSKEIKTSDGTNSFVSDLKGKSHYKQQPLVLLVVSQAVALLAVGRRLGHRYQHYIKLGGAHHMTTALSVLHS
ncbi:hypothetical protein L1887_03632 [Cichorium endivia]|nr:hypothetical protein L1887_03632 [Cichorium endivia]